MALRFPVAGRRTNRGLQGTPPGLAAKKLIIDVSKFIGSHLGNGSEHDHSQ